MSVEVFLTEYKTLRDEIRDDLNRVRHVRIALVSSTAALVGVAALGDVRLLSPVVYLVPFLIVVLCLIGTIDIREAHLAIAIKSIYIQLRIENHPELKGSLAWETTCDKMYRALGKDSIQKVLRREPVPWLLIVSIMFFSWLILVRPTPALVGAPFLCPYILGFVGLFMWALWQVEDLQWPERGKLKMQLASKIPGFLDEQEASEHNHSPCT